MSCILVKFFILCQYIAHLPSGVKFWSTRSIRESDTVPPPSTIHGYCRDNELGVVGWRAVMAALEGCTALTSINGVACSGLVAGALTDLQLGSKEEGFALSFVRYLERSCSTLVSLDMRYIVFLLSECDAGLTKSLCCMLSKLVLSLRIICLNEI